MSAIRIEVATQFSDELLRGISALVPQLSSSRHALTAAELREITACPVVRLLTAKDGTEVVGMLTLLLVRIPTGLRAILEDLAVDAAYRRQGVGSALMMSACDIAAKAGARTVDFTSRPSRVDANRLYLNLGFERRDTGIFRLTLEKRDADR